MNKENIIIGAFGVLLIVAIVGGYFFPKFSSQFTAGSSAGSSFNTAKVAEQVVTTATTTAFSLSNGDSSDRTITGADIMLKGGTSTTTAYTIKCATSTSASSLNSNINYVLNMDLTASSSIFGTTTAMGMYMASSSPGLTGTSTASTVSNATNAFVRNWATGTNLTCLVTTGDGYNAFNSGITGFFAFPYRGQ